MVGYVWRCLDMQGYGGICEGGGLHVVRSPCTCFAKVFCLPPWLLHVIRKLFKLKRASRSIAKTGFSRSSKSMAGAMFQRHLGGKGVSGSGFGLGVVSGCLLGCFLVTFLVLFGTFWEPWGPLWETFGELLQLWVQLLERLLGCGLRGSLWGGSARFLRSF